MFGLTNHYVFIIIIIILLLFLFKKNHYVKKGVQCNGFLYITF